MKQSLNPHGNNIEHAPAALDPELAPDQPLAPDQEPPGDGSSLGGAGREVLSPGDHRHIGRRMALFHQQPEAAGMVYWHPAGFQLYQSLEQFVRQAMLKDGYAEVRSPQLMNRSVWEASGHWAHFREHMFCFGDGEAALKPVSCPGHLAVFKALAPSYRDLPLRLCEFGLVHRDEASGALQGLLRLRQFTQDDGHILCEPEQAEAEVERFLRGVRPFYAAFGFDQVSVALSTRPEDRAGSDAEWDRGEAVLKAVLERLGWEYELQPGAGAFYGPKLEFGLEDSHGRKWQCGTVQFDLFMPERFRVRYAAQDGSKARPVMLHRALCGSLERFIGILLEHHQGHLPVWLAPRQVRVLPVAPAQAGAARELLSKLRELGVRAEADASSESLGRRVREANQRGVAVVVVLGEREVVEGSVSLREGNAKRELSQAAFLQELAARARPPV